MAGVSGCLKYSMFFFNFLFWVSIFLWIISFVQERGTWDKYHNQEQTYIETGGMRRKRHFPFNCLDLFVSLWLFRELKISQWLWKKKKGCSSSLKINMSQMFSYCCKTKHRGKYPLIKGRLFLVICQSAISGLRTLRKTVCFSLASGSLPWHLGLKQVTN